MSQTDYERGFIDGMQKQMQSSVDRAVSAMAKREWVGLTDEEIVAINDKHYNIAYRDFDADVAIARAIEAKLKEKNT